MQDPHPHLHAVTNEDGAVLLDIDRGSISTLNPIGAYIWQGLRRGNALSVIISNLACETGAEHSLVEREANEFVEELRKNHLFPSANEGAL